MRKSLLAVLVTMFLVGNLFGQNPGETYSNMCLKKEVLPYVNFDDRGNIYITIDYYEYIGYVPVALFTSILSYDKFSRKKDKITGVIYAATSAFFIIKAITPVRVRKYIYIKSNKIGISMSF